MIFIIYKVSKSGSLFDYAVPPLFEVLERACARSVIRQPDLTDVGSFDVKKSLEGNRSLIVEVPTEVVTLS